MIGNGSLGPDVTGAVTGDIDVRIGGNAIFSTPARRRKAGSAMSPAPGTETGNVIFLMNSQNGSQSGLRWNSFLAADIVGGDFTLVASPAPATRGPGRGQFCRTTAATR